MDMISLIAADHDVMIGSHNDVKFIISYNFISW
jgi:hypothetical protein